MATDVTITTVEVPDILIARGGQLQSLRGQTVWKGGMGHTFNTGSGVVKNGVLYALKRKETVTISDCVLHVPLVGGDFTEEFSGARPAAADLSKMVVESSGDVFFNQGRILWLGANVDLTASAGKGLEFTISCACRRTGGNGRETIWRIDNVTNVHFKTLGMTAFHANGHQASMGDTMWYAVGATRRLPDSSTYDELVGVRYADGTARIFINGVDCTRDAADLGGVEPVVRAFSQFGIGGEGVQVSNCVFGYIKHCRLFSRALTDEEVLALNADRQ